ncbi:hypothetical protein QJS10_CPB21g01035 [Acorus calamus]|uniref:Uncharacterized protein n=1 Tax=Acorus calamus TaxID=4465 RepID=A0AAV9C5B1_ACOCL|nr:hypothetical protein QJS10_CPB21g01035 [Acorus calamus]
MDRIRTSPSDVIVTDKKDSTNKRTFKFKHRSKNRRPAKKEGGEPPTLKGLEPFMGGRGLAAPSGPLPR